MPTAILKADSGASGTYLKLEDKIACTNVIPTKNPTTVLLPTQETMCSTHDAELPIWELSKSARSAKIFPDLTSASLLSIWQLCDDNCTAIFSKEKLQVIKNDRVILQGIRNDSDGLWDVPIYKTQQQPLQTANAIINKNSSKKKLAE